MEDKKNQEQEISIGIVGLGMMGCSIATCLLLAGHSVVAVAPIKDDLISAEKRIGKHLQKSFMENMTQHEPDYFLKNLIITEDYNELKDCKLVIECTIEDVQIKESVYKKIEKSISPDALLTSNTSAIPVSLLQQHTEHPNRFFGLHWPNLLILHDF